MTTKNTFSVYRIWSPSSTLEYYGSTTQILSQRFGGHARNHRKWQAGKYNYVSSFEIMKFSDARIELVEVVDTKSKQVLRAREGHYIRTNDCVNKNVAGRTAAEYHIDNREHELKRINAYNAGHRAEAAAKIECPCGGKYTHANTSRHKKTAKHLAYIAAQPATI